MEMKEETRIYTTSKGAIALKSPTKNKIIELLMEGNKTGSELQRELDLAKSTVSVHLSDLIKIGVISEQTDPEDKRKKIFSIDSRLVGVSENPSDEQYRLIIKNLAEVEEDRYLFLKNIFHLIRYGLSSMGLDLHPALKSMGYDAGIALADNFRSEDLEGLLLEIRYFWKNNGLGKVSVGDKDTIIVEDCFDCGGMPDIGECLCSFDEGLMEGIIKGKLGISMDIDEIECHGTGSKKCVFKIELRH